VLRIYLVRHATAQGKDEALPDLERSLIKKGEKEAAVIAGHLVSRYAPPDLMISSFANRAIETAHRLAKAFHYPRQRILLRDIFYGNSNAEDLVKEIRSQADKYRSLMLFGHDPAISRLAAWLVKGFQEELPKAGVVAADFPVQRWREIGPGSGRLLEFISPAGEIQARSRLTAGVLQARRPAPVAGEAGMGTLQALKESYGRRILVFRDHFAAVSAHPSTEAVHDLRVALKRLRTFFKLVEAIDTEFGAGSAFAAARKLFRAAGRVRNLQVLEAKAYEASQSAGLDLSEYYNWLKEAEGREAAKLGRACGRFSRKTLTAAWKPMAAGLEELGDRRVGSRMGGRLMALIREIRAERTMRHDVRRLHFLRTRTKEARYTLEVLQECGLTGDEGRVLNDRLKDVHQPLGRWHDGEVVLESLRDFRKRRDPGPFFSPKSYIEFSGQAKARKAEDLAAFEAAWTELVKFLGRGYGRRVLLPPSPSPAPEAPSSPSEVPPDAGLSGSGSNDPRP
jgi:phosphohistidine phosphatase